MTKTVRLANEDKAAKYLLTAAPTAVELDMGIQVPTSTHRYGGSNIVSLDKHKRWERLPTLLAATADVVIESKNGGNDIFSRDNKHKAVTHFAVFDWLL